MPDLRTDWLTGRRVIIAENRAARPNEFSQHGNLGLVEETPAIANATEGATLASPANCPFCPGHEHKTPPAVYQQNDAAGQWRVRVTPNKYPAVTFGATGAEPTGTQPVPIEAIVAEFPCAELSFTPPSAETTERREAYSISAIGAQEVIIESARHVTSTAALTHAELRDVLVAYVARLQQWSQDGRVRYALIFKNQGPGAGASLAHLHSQLIVLPEAPPSVGAEVRRAEESHRDYGQCPYCRWIADERSRAERIVLDRDGFIAFCPFSSIQPLEFWLFPSEHEPLFERIDSLSLERLTGVLHTLLQRLESILPSANYNLILRSGPWLPDSEAWCHWRIEVLPRVASLAGLELGSGTYINPLSPEHAAQRLRDAT